MSDRRIDPIRLFTGVALATAAALAVDAFLIEPAWVQITHHELPIPDLPEEWRGKRLVHLTDLHYGDPRSDALFRWMVRAVNELEPDLIVYTGDFILRRAAEVRPCFGYLKRLRSRQGAVAVLGDHDYDPRTKRPMRRLIPAIADAGIRLIENGSLELPGGLRLAGIEALTHKIQRGDLAAALATLAPATPHLLLAHSPDIIVDAALRGVPAILCGHTHGGQVVVPFYGPPITHTKLGRAFASGWSEMGETRMFTSRGFASHESVRFLCRPEIAVFTLVDR